MTEDLLYYIWQHKLFNSNNLKTELGEPIHVIKPGDRHNDSGPDFFNARIKIGKTEWAGNVEIHINAKDWIKHKHQGDKAYDNTILHVVFESGAQVKRTDGGYIPTLELKNNILPNVVSNYKNLNKTFRFVACEKQIEEVPTIVTSSWLERLAIERLEQKSKTILDSLKTNNNNWEETFYQQMARGFGYKVNADAFELLARHTPNLILAKHKNSIMQIEALLFGQSGLLADKSNDKYVQILQNEYQFLKQKFSLTPIDAHVWKFMRLRPAAFPTIRISQFAALVFQSTSLFSKMISAASLKEVRELLNVKSSEYWQTHYQFEKVAPARIKHFGNDAIDVLLINTLIPFLFIYGKQQAQQDYCDRALKFLDEIEGEDNSITRSWIEAGMLCENAMQSQALIQLKNNYCKSKRCLQCNIGNSILKKK